jgi:hypothetical protein
LRNKFVWKQILIVTKRRVKTAAGFAEGKCKKKKNILRLTLCVFCHEFRERHQVFEIADKIRQKREEETCTSFSLDKKNKSIQLEGVVAAPEGKRSFLRSNKSIFLENTPPSFSFFHFKVRACWNFFQNKKTNGGDDDGGGGGRVLVQRGW